MKPKSNRKKSAKPSSTSRAVTDDTQPLSSASRRASTRRGRSSSQYRVYEENTLVYTQLTKQPLKPGERERAEVLATVLQPTLWELAKLGLVRQAMSTDGKSIKWIFDADLWTVNMVLK